jgi:CRP-like cAMP-binding protein
MLDRLLPGEGTTGSLSRILQLTRFPSIVGGLPASELAFMAEVLQERVFPKGAFLLRSGEPVRSIYLVLEGKCHVRRRGRDLGHVVKWGGIGGFNLFARDEEGLEVRAETEVTALELQAAALYELLEDRFAILRHLIRELCRTFIQLMSEHAVPISLVGRTLTGLPERDLDLVDRIVFLRQSLAFSHSSIDALSHVARWITEQRFEREVTLWTDGEPATQAHLIVGGSVRCRSTDGRLDFRLGPGSPLGAVESMAEVPRWYTAVTETEVVTLTGDIEGLLDVFEDNYAVALDYVGGLAREILGLLERLADRGKGPMRELYGCED